MVVAFAAPADNLACGGIDFIEVAALSVPVEFVFPISVRQVSLADHQLWVFSHFGRWVVDALPNIPFAELPEVLLRR